MLLPFRLRRLTAVGGDRPRARLPALPVGRRQAGAERAGPRDEIMNVLTTMSMLALLTGCQTALQAESTAPAPDDERVWVAARVVGGKSCQSPPFAPPDTKQALEEAGITVFETAIEYMGVCMACDICPAYAAIHRALIPQADMERARQLGFQPGDAPRPP